MKRIDYSFISTYPTNGNPICPYSKKECIKQDMDGYTDCSDCPDFGNDTKATGDMPCLEWLYNKIKSIFN